MRIEKPVVYFIIGVAVFSIATGSFLKVNGLRNQMISLETGLSRQYADNQNALSNYILGYTEQLGIADRQAEQLDRVLQDAVRGRYERDYPGKAGQALFSAIAEAYPEIDLDSYDKILDFIQAQRSAFKHQQTRLLDQIRNYESFRQQGLIDSNLITLLGYPGETLEVTVGGQTLTGEQALEKMNQIVLDDTTVGAFNTGKMAPLGLPSAQTR